MTWFRHSHVVPVFKLHNIHQLTKYGIADHKCSFLLDLLNEFGKRDKMRGLPSNLYLFRNEFYNKFNNTGARMLDSIQYLMALRLL